MFATAKNTAKEDMVNEGGHAATDIKEGARRTKHDARHAAGVLKDDIQDMARQAGQHVRELADSAEHTADAMTMKIRDNPIQSSFIALGIGVALGMFFRR